MSGLTSKLQLDILSELVRWKELPLPSLDPIHIEIILELLQQAYDGIKEDYPDSIFCCDEKYLNSLMVGRLNNLVGVDIGASQLIQSVWRGAETINFNAIHIEKRPDIHINLTSKDHPFPLIIECKIIDAPDGKTIYLYCEKGLERFIRGDYAWTNSEAMMLAYVRDMTSITSHLQPYINKAALSRPPRYSVVLPPQKCCNPFLADAAQSIHNRSFSYTHPPQQGAPPGDITIWHLWVH